MVTQQQSDKGTCRKGLYRTNQVVLHKPLVCLGGYGQPTCEFLNVCYRENHLRGKK